MKRIFLTVLDACGVGELPDAADYGDVGACTIGHAVDVCHPSLPNMAHMGLGQIAGAHYPADENAVGAFGMCREASKGKDTTTGHWEIAGVTLAKPFPTFPNGFPAENRMVTYKTPEVPQRLPGGFYRRVRAAHRA